MNIKNLDCPVVIMNPSNPGGVEQGLKECFKEAKSMFQKRPQLIVCIIDKYIKDIYAQIKKISLTEAGIVTQCMLFKNVQYADSIKDQYISNVALKANIKIGGATNYIDTLSESDGTMYLGADVTHAAPGSMAPSIAAIVSSVDGNCTRYHTFLHQQGHREELITKMEDIMNQALTNYQSKNDGKSPTRIIFFRDGVASGQFADVIKVEIGGIHKALAKLNIKAPVTFLVVQKRHHIRLFPTDNNVDRSGNCRPGTIVDNGVTHPTEFNFILQSHAGIQGMSRPTIYHVIHDENKFTADAIQKLCYDLCFLAERATRTISIVAPAYRAHLAAFCKRS
jgi:eukaryotic translation initiation factor 2C